MTLADQILVGLALGTAPFAVLRRGLVPVALTLAAMAGTAVVLALSPPPFLARVLFTAWPAPMAALAVHAFGAKSKALPVLAGFLYAGLLAALLREVPDVAAMPEANRAALYLLIYRASRLTGLAVVSQVLRRPRTLPQAAAVVLALSAAWDVVIWFTSAPWRSWSAPNVLAGVTWAVLSAMILGWRKRQK